MLKQLFIFFLFGLLAFKSTGNTSIDSLRKLAITADDTTQVKLYNDIFKYFTNVNNDSAFHYAYKGLKLAQRIDYPKGIKIGHIELAHKFVAIGNYDAADSIATELLNYATTINDKKGIGNAYFLFGLSSDYQGKYAIAIENYVNSLEIMEELQYYKGVANCYTNIGIVYYFEKMYDKTIENYKKAYRIVKKHNIDHLEENLLNNIANVFYQQNVLDSALLYYKHSYRLIFGHDDQSELGTICGNIGLVFEEKGELDSAIFYHNMAVAEHIKHQNNYGLATTYKDLGKLNNSFGRYNEAVKYLDQSIAISKEINAIQVEESAYGHIHKSYFGLGDLTKAYQYQQKYANLKDSIINERSSQQILEVETKYQTEVKEKEIIKLSEQNAQKELNLLKKEAENNRNLLLFILIGSVVFIGLVFFYIAFKQKQKSNAIIVKQNEELNQINEEIMAQRDEIESQKNLVDEKNLLITSSINYAKRIQEAILPPDELIKKHLPNSFVVYLPKDVVAGDFYWLEVVDNLVLFAVADCTGHGVPGAMVSVVCNGALNRSVREYGLRDPASILNKTRELVIDTFERSEHQVMDGMDIAICALDHNKKVIQYAGANNPLYVLKDDEIQIIKADRQPIGYSSSPKPFTLHEINFSEVEELFLFSDGYADQFGGERGKKMGYRKFKELLLSIADKSAQDQLHNLEMQFEQWRGHEEQLDDVCLIGLKL